MGSANCAKLPPVSVPSYTVENHRGGLVEATVRRLTTEEDAQRYAADVIVCADGVRGGRPLVLCADHRTANVYPPQVADVLVTAFRPNNRRFERIAILVSPDNAMLLMQLRRLTREAGSDRRQVFLEENAALAHLRVTLDAAELERARTFLLGQLPAVAR